MSLVETALLQDLKRRVEALERQVVELRNGVVLTLRPEIKRGPGRPPKKNAA